MPTDPPAWLREAAETALRNLGHTCEPPQLSAEHWQRVLAAVEVRMQMRGVPLPEGWRDDLSVQMGRTQAGPVTGSEN